jgi:hypothetical protein
MERREMMTKFFYAAFAAGAGALAWIAAGFASSSWLAVAMTVLIAAMYLLGAFELRQFRRATAALDQLLDATREAPATLGEWLKNVPGSLRDAVRLRVQGERGALPGAALTPYLVGLLVMLGMLGTFLGMVVTFKGTVFALERSTDLQAMRAALAAPIRGLGLSFGTSVAGVASSAMLGLMATIARRERLEVARKLESVIAGVLLQFSLVHQRQESFEAIHLQSRVLPQLVDKLEALMDRMERRGEQLDAKLLERHGAMQREVSEAYARLAQDVGVSLKDSMSASARAAGEAIRPVAESTMAHVAQQAERLHARLGEVAQSQVETIATQLTALRDEEQRRGDAAVARLAELQAAVAQHLASLGRALEEPLHRLLLTASEVPDAAAGVIAQLREEMSRIGERDNMALQERNVLLEQLRDLLQAVNAASEQQRTATDALLASASTALEQAGTRFTELLDAQSAKAADTSAHIAAGAVELSAVAEVFGEGVQQFHAGNDKLVESLDRMEASLRRSTARSDEQLAYYVAQAREVIDLSIASQQGLVENLRALRVAPIKTRPAEGNAA